jgi:predicted phage terminase large subunit-like protein
VRLPPLSRWQTEVRSNRARFKVVCCGRQSGKTVLGAVTAVEEASNEGDVWWVAPSFPIGELGWAIIDGLCRQIPGCKFEGRPVWRITLPSGGTIQLRSADNPDSLRGATLSLVIFDEAAIAKPDAWPTLRPTLSVRKGRAMFISTPKGTNWFYDLFQDAGELSQWARWRYPSTSNPHLDPEDVAEARRTMSSLIFSQEYEAEFISHTMGLFHADWIHDYRTHIVGDGDKVYMLGDEAVPDASCSKFHTVDLAWTAQETADYTVISTWAVTPKRHLLLIDCDRGHYEGPDIPKRLQTAHLRYGGYFAIERATRQMSIIQEAERLGLPIRVVRAEKDKVARALPATARMERGTIWFPHKASTPWWPPLEEEVLAFPASRHDDFVDTLSYAALEVARSGSAYSDHEPVIV